MRRLLVSPIVTGHGEFHCVRILLERIWYEELRVPEGHIEVLRPLRHPQSTLETKDGLQKAVRQAHMDLSGELRRAAAAVESLVLILLDSDRRNRDIKQWEDEFKGWAAEVDGRIDVECVVIVVEYETWFVAAAGSLGDYLDLRGDLAGPDHPEAQGCGARWIEERFKRGTYVKPRDQPRMTRAMDLNAYRERSPSFERLCQKLGKYVR